MANTRHAVAPLAGGSPLGAASPLGAQPALTALADPTRRQVFERLAIGPAAVGEIAAGLPVSRPAVSQHLKALKQAGLVTDQADGTRRVYRIDPAGLGALRAWLDQFWCLALDAFKVEVERKALAARKAEGLGSGKEPTSEDQGGEDR